MRAVFIMHPPETVIIDEDTSFALMLEAQERGHQVEHTLIHSMFLHRSRLGAVVRHATMQRDPKQPLLLGETKKLWLDEVDVIFIRKDPPFDANYLWATLLLEHVRGKTLVINDPRALREANEKLFAMQFGELMPETFVSADRQQIHEFVNEVGGQAVIKPIDGAGGAGVLALRSDDINFKAIVEALTANGQRIAMVQRLMPEVRQGDKRILLLNGEALGAILRVPQQDDLRSNIHVGGSVHAATLSAEDKTICERLGEPLRQNGLFFVGIDVIAGKLTEINVTSPTGIQQMSRLMNENLSARVWDFVQAQL